MTCSFFPNILSVSRSIVDKVTHGPYLLLQPSFSIDPIALTRPVVIGIALDCDHRPVAPPFDKADMGGPSQLGEPDQEDIARFGYLLDILTAFVHHVLADGK